MTYEYITVFFIIIMAHIFQFLTILAYFITSYTPLSRIYSHLVYACTFIIIVHIYIFMSLVLFSVLQMSLNYAAPYGASPQYLDIRQIVVNEGQCNKKAYIGKYVFFLNNHITILCVVKLELTGKFFMALWWGTLRKCKESTKIFTLTN